MKPAIVAAVRETRNPGCVRRDLIVDGADAAYFEITGAVLPPPLALWDFAAVALIFSAMRAGRPLHIDGPVSTMLLRNLEELQDVWAMWHPESYTPVPITAADERDACAEAAPGTGIFAYSGGVDSASTLLRHLSEHRDHRTVRPLAAVMIHGFDIPLSEPAAFETARTSAADALAPFALPLSVVRTNWRGTICQRWEMEFGAGLAACLHQFTGAAATGVLGSGEDYAHIVIPWGSNPVTDPMLSGGGFDIRLECRGLTRTERVAMICRQPDVASRLRVCWEGPMTGRNCGRCEKCIRTYLNFLACGQEPRCFTDRLTLSRILGLRAAKTPQISLLEEIRSSARANGIKGAWLTALSVNIAKNKLLRPIRPFYGRAIGKARRMAKAHVIDRLFRSRDRREIATPCAGATAGASRSPAQDRATSAGRTG